MIKNKSKKSANRDSNRAQERRQEMAQMKALVKRVEAIQRQSAPIAYGTPRRSRKPSFAGRDGAIVIKHSELFDWPAGGATFTTNVSIHINPGLQQMFPWVGAVATNFEKYEFHHLAFRYTPRCSTTQVGQAIIAVDPKSGDPGPHSLQTVATYSNRENAPMWKDMCVVVDRELLKGKRFVRSYELDSEQVATLYDVGRFLFCTDGASPASAVIGELEVEYELALYNPAAPPQDAIEGCWANGVPTGASSSNIFGNSPTTGGLLMDFIANNGVTLNNCVPDGVNQPTRYSAWLYLTGTGLTAASIAYTNAAAVNALVNPLGAGTTLMAYFTFRPTASNPVLIFTVTATTVTDCLLAVARAPNDLPF